MQPLATPEALAHLTELSLDATGAFVLFATDDYFAPKESLLRPHAPEWREGAYTERGKWMDGWESARRRSPGHDWAIVRLGIPGRIEAIVCDTTHFKGNAPQEVSLEALEAPSDTSLEELLAMPRAHDAAEAASLAGRAWVECVPRTAVRPDSVNVLAAAAPPRATHVRLHIHPDGGVARLRVFGRVRPEADVFRGPGSVDLAAIENGGTIALASDSFFGPPGNLLLPGRGTNMGDGWETRRRRTPGSDWCVIRLGRRGLVQHLELDTHFFKGNAPQAVRIEWLDAGAEAGEMDSSEVKASLASESAWRTLVGRTVVSQHRRHRLVPAFGRVVTHLRVHILPHGGVNRLRVFGEAADSAGERRALARLLEQPPAARQETLSGFGASAEFARALESRLPVVTVRELLAQAAAALASLGETDLIAAFSAHPRLGAAPVATDSTPHAESSRREQAALGASASELRERLSAGGEAYARKFGFPFLAFASGRGARELLELLEERLENDRPAEISNASLELARITRLRIGRWLDAHGD